jgi:hypothetical protein
MFKVQRSMFNIARWLLTAILLSEASARAATDATNSPVANAVPKTNAVSSTDFQSFKIISERNIFSSSRSGRVSRSGPVVKPKKIDTFTLVGTVDYSKGLFAIFEGSSSSFKKSVKVGDTFAGFAIKDIALDQVTIGTTNAPDSVLHVGSQMRREDEGDWHPGSGAAPSVAKAEPTSHADTAAAETDSIPPSDEAPPSAAENDVLKRLMQKRKAEVKHESE